MHFPRKLTWGHTGNPVSLNSLSFDEAMDALAQPVAGGSSSAADPEFYSEDF
ncbi:MAG: hypothetical protein J4O01_11545 [Chloroflexi bacterium]|nr:hypothetical protein [Chloroflexota bacterium]MCI0852676.1 hypothetical protein [Chloroflexota bacterium]